MDIIAVDGATVVFVEVRSTEQASTQMPALSVDRRKQERLTRLAVYYLKRNGLLNCSARMDVLAVSWPPQKVEPRITHYPNAFEATGRFQIFS